MNASSSSLEAQTRYLKIKGTLERREYKSFLKLMKEGVEKGKAPLTFKERRIYFYDKTGRQIDILQFAERTNLIKGDKLYSIRYHGMTSIRKDCLRSGVGGDYECSDEGAGLINEMGMIAFKERCSTGHQWQIGNNIYLILYDINQLTKGKSKCEVKGMPLIWEMIAFCYPTKEEEVSKEMQMHVELLQPYLVKRDKRDKKNNIGY